MAALCRKLAEVGFIAVAIDAPYHGERKSGKGETDYDDAIIRAYRGSGEHPFFYDTVFDVMRLVDYLSTRDDVDASRIGLIGISKGGVETYLTAAVDPRISVAVHRAAPVADDQQRFRQPHAVARRHRMHQCRAKNLRRR
jgi:cephalosporin-C deacetylase-like acetyl esterase